jgi:hypothetical protein
MTAFVGTQAFAGVTIVINNKDAAGEGFNDATPFVPVGGNPATTLGQARLNAFEHAASIWADVLNSNVTIEVDANMDPLTCTADGAVGGFAGSNAVSKDFAGAPETDTYYPIALANAIAGVDLDPGTADINATFNSDVDNAVCLGDTSWYYGFDANPPAGDIDFVTVVLHELGHGLGFQTFIDVETGAKFDGTDDAFMLLLEHHGATPSAYSGMTDAQRLAANTADPDLHWLGAEVLKLASDIPLTAGFLSGHVRMYAPDPVELGSSVSHFSTALSPDELMEPSYTAPDHNVGMSLRLMQDIGWPADGTDVYFLVDLSGSFQDDLPLFKLQAPDIVNDLLASNANTRFGLGRFEDYPISPFGTGGDVAYTRVLDITNDVDLVLSTILGLGTQDGADEPESQLAALYQSATGEGQDLSAQGEPSASIPAGQQASFRRDATKLIVLWTDAPFHQPGDPGDIPYPGPGEATTIAALNALGRLQVIGISSGGGGLADLAAISAATGALAPPGGVDCDGDGVVDIPEGEPLVCGIAATGQGIAPAIIALVESATIVPIEIDIKPGSDVNPVNPGSNGVIPVAILTTDGFDATGVVPLSVEFGPGGAKETHGKGHIKDVDGDGDMDLLLHFKTQEAALSLLEHSVRLVGETYTDDTFQGADSVVFVRSWW